VHVVSAERVATQARQTGVERLARAPCLGRSNRTQKSLRGADRRLKMAHLAGQSGYDAREDAPESEIEALPIEDELCSHVLVDRSNGSRARATDASNNWPLKNCASP
jgi:hypothetical protein